MGEKITKWIYHKKREQETSNNIWDTDRDICINKQKKTTEKWSILILHFKFKNVVLTQLSSSGTCVSVCPKKKLWSNHILKTRLSTEAYLDIHIDQFLHIWVPHTMHITSWPPKVRVYQWRSFPDLIKSRGTCTLFQTWKILICKMQSLTEFPLYLLRQMPLFQ